VRPRRIVLVTGTGTEVGKTWLAERAVAGLRDNGQRVAARKPAQSFSPQDTETDADRLAHASGENPTVVCPCHRWYPAAMAPPMAAEALGLVPPTVADLVDELDGSWPDHEADIGVVEGAGGVASPLGSDGDSADLCRALVADGAVVVADAGLGTINAVRLATRALAPLPVAVYLNRFDPDDDLHRRNRRWLEERDGLTVAAAVTELLPFLLDGSA
jgi:dethiobiotin synthetase